MVGWVGGWVVGLVGNKANLSPSSVGARVGAELGNFFNKGGRGEELLVEIQLFFFV